MVVPGPRTLLTVAVQSSLGLFEDLEKAVLVPEPELVDELPALESCTVVSTRR
jgi:hypothetical protein